MMWYEGNLRAEVFPDDYTFLPLRNVTAGGLLTDSRQVQY